MKFAIVGYGNLGKSLEKQIVNDKDDQLVAIFSRRKITHPLAQPWKNFESKTNFDVALIALGSYQDIRTYRHLFAKVNTVDCYDNTDDISQYKSYLAQNKAPQKLSIVGAGWDPGLLDIVRKSLGNNAVTLWGKGISLGHSNALRAIDGVLDAVAITQPLDNATQLIQQGKANLHKRTCYVSAVDKDKQRIANQISTMPHYFEGQNVEIVFCSPQQVKRQKENTFHKGQVLYFDNYCSANFCVEMPSNNNFTAKIMVRYAKILPKLVADGFCGAVDLLDIPLRYLR